MINLLQHFRCGAKKFPSITRHHKDCSLQQHCSNISVLHPPQQRISLLWSAVCGHRARTEHSEICRRTVIVATTAQKRCNNSLRTSLFWSWSQELASNGWAKGARVGAALTSGTHVHLTAADPMPSKASTKTEDEQITHLWYYSMCGGHSAFAGNHRP